MPKSISKFFVNRVLLDSQFYLISTFCALLISITLLMGAIGYNRSQVNQKNATANPANSQVFLLELTANKSFSQRLNPNDPAAFSLSENLENLNGQNINPNQSEDFFVDDLITANITIPADINQLNPELGIKIFRKNKDKDLLIQDIFLPNLPINPKKFDLPSNLDSGEYKIEVWFENNLYAQELFEIKSNQNLIPNQNFR